jgi:predicted SAM-dependent methyltransferase
VFASHVLEHVIDDDRAMKEIRRVLRCGGVALLPVPIHGDTTDEYPEPNPTETNHVRCPGRDYFDKMAAVFSSVRVFSSEDFSDQFQLFSYEDLNGRLSPSKYMWSYLLGKPHEEYVPVCHKS